MAYILEGMKRLPSIKSYQMKFTAENLEIEGDFIFGMITNSMSVGGFKRITGKYVELDDGEFEVTLIKRPTNAIELNQILTDLVNRNIDTDQMYCFKTASLHICLLYTSHPSSCAISVIRSKCVQVRIYGHET